MRESAAACQVMVSLGGMYREFFGGTLDTPARAILAEAVEIADRLADPYSVNLPWVELGHVAYSDDLYEDAIDCWTRALRAAQSVRNHERTADGFNRLAQAFIAAGRLDEGERALAEAMEAAKVLPDTLGGRRDKEMYIRRHLGMLRQAAGDLDGAIAVLAESAATYRARRSTNGLFRTLLMLADCLYERGARSEIDVLRPELEDLAGRTRMADWIARWQCLVGHLAVDDWRAAGDAAVTAYGDALVTAVRWNARTLDHTATRILWRLSLLEASDGHERPSNVLAGLRAQWRTVRIDNVPMPDVVAAARGRDPRDPSRVSHDADFLSNRKGIASLSWSRRPPRLWEGL
jgi:hypothetical protein